MYLLVVVAYGRNDLAAHVMRDADGDVRVDVRAQLHGDERAHAPPSHGAHRQHALHRRRRVFDGAECVAVQPAVHQLRHAASHTPHSAFRAAATPLAMLVEVQRQRRPVAGGKSVARTLCGCRVRTVNEETG